MELKRVHHRLHRKRRFICAICGEKPKKLIHQIQKLRPIKSVAILKTS